MEKILDAIQLPPAIKHKTILETFENLKEGEGFILHNDHDPKPLYYQLSATKGDIFTWDYLQQGPDIFEIRIAKKKNLEKDSYPDTPIAETNFKRINFSLAGQKDTVSKMVAMDSRKLAVFEKLGIDCYWKANKTLTEACSAAGINMAEVNLALEKIDQQERPVLPSQDYNLWDLRFLANHILQTHHQYVKDNEQLISNLAENAGRSYGDKRPELKILEKEVGPMIQDFLVHMSKEESVLFPAIIRMAELLSEGKAPEMHGGGIANAIERMEAEHDETGVALKRFRKITNDYQTNGAQEEICTRLFQKLEEFERDTYLHVHLENNILFPKAILLEKELLK